MNKFTICLTVLTVFALPAVGIAENSLTGQCWDLVALIRSSMVLGKHLPSKTDSRVMQYRPLIELAGQRYNVDPDLIHSVIKMESDYNPRAVSKKGARGLMQLMSDTAGDMQVQNAFDPEDNILGGTRYLRYLLNLYDGNLRKTLMAYNAGPKTVRLNDIPPETYRYVNKVLNEYRNKKQGGKKS